MILVTGATGYVGGRLVPRLRKRDTACGCWRATPPGWVTYRDLMLGYERLRGLRRWLVPVPALTPRPSTHYMSGEAARRKLRMMAWLARNSAQGTARRGRGRRIAPTRGCGA